MKKIILSTVIVFIAWFILDMIIHQAILGTTYAEYDQVFRSKEDMMMGLMVVVGLISAFSFVAIYSWFFRDKGVGPGLKYGFWFGMVAGVSMGYGSYSAMLIPYSMALTWFLGTLVEMMVAGIIVGAIDKGSET